MTAPGRNRLLGHALEQAERRPIGEFREVFSALEKDTEILLDDGKVRLPVERAGGEVTLVASQP